MHILFELAIAILPEQLWRFKNEGRCPCHFEVMDMNTHQPHPHIPTSHAAGDIVVFYTNCAFFSLFNSFFLPSLYLLRLCAVSKFFR